VHGATNWQPPSFSPRTGLYYQAHFENSATVVVEGQFPRAAGINPRATTMGQTNLQNFYNDEGEAYGVVRAYDPATLEAKWEFKMSDITWAGVLTTAGDVAFSGGKEGYFVALDARSGALLWRAALGGQINAGPMSYAVNGKQFITIAAGNALFAYGLR
jgi:glucose dehydrogenase